MATMKIKKGDMVKVIAGKDKDKEGKVIAVNHKNGTVHNRLVIQNIHFAGQFVQLDFHHADHVRRW